MDVVECHRRACEGFAERVRALSADVWSGPTPCSDWDVRALVNHVVGENLWAVPLLAGRTIAEVGDRFDGDVLGDDPVATATASVAGAVAASAEPGAMERTVHLSFGDVPGEEYAWQLTADNLIHSWDLARATGGDERLDREVVDAIAPWFAEREPMYRQGGFIAARPAVSTGGDAQAELLVGFGRDPGLEGRGGHVTVADTGAARDARNVVDRFNDAFFRGDIDAVMTCMTDDCVFESTGPAPDGSRFEGAAAVRTVFAEFFDSNPAMRFETEQLLVQPGWAVLRWRYSWSTDGYVRGIDLLRIDGGKVAAKHSYVKG